jgi:peptide-methionine (S)-S-oxide reductase
MNHKLCGAILALCGAVATAGEKAVPLPPPAFDVPKAEGPMQTAVIAGGCFWGVQGVFEHLTGVRRVVSGYAGGHAATARYQDVSGGHSGHAESVQITYDPKLVSFGEILQVFFSVAHDPTQLDRQGPDVGPQYRSAIFYGNEQQKQVAAQYVAQLDAAKLFPKRIVTRLEPLAGFHDAEDYHQDYLLKNPTDPYIVINDLPKIRNFERVLPGLYRNEPVTVAADRR